MAGTVWIVKLNLVVATCRQANWSGEARKHKLPGELESEETGWMIWHLLAEWVGVLWCYGVLALMRSSAGVLVDRLKRGTRKPADHTDWKKTWNVCVLCTDEPFLKYFISTLGCFTWKMAGSVDLDSLPSALWFSITLFVFLTHRCGGKNGTLYNIILTWS